MLNQTAEYSNTPHMQNGRHMHGTWVTSFGTTHHVSLHTTAAFLETTFTSLPSVLEEPATQEKHA